MKALILGHTQLPEYMAKFLTHAETYESGNELVAKGALFKCCIGFRIDHCGNLIIRGII